MSTDAMSTDALSTDSRSPTPLATASRALESWLRRRYDESPRPRQLPRPSVVPLGATDAHRLTDDPASGRRRTANVHLTAQAVLIGPRAAAPDGRTACGHCLAIRWQRLRPKLHQDALEFGTETRATGAWPILGPHVLDAVWAAFQAAYAGRARQSGTAPDRAAAKQSLARVFRLDLRTLAVRGVPVLREPLCPACAVAPAAPDTGPRLDLRPRAKPHPSHYRLREPDAYDLPGGALANPVCGAIGTSTSLIITSPTTAPVSGAALIRGYSGFVDLTWSGQSNAYGLSRHLALLEGLERYAGTRNRTGTPTVFDSYANLREIALDPRDCGVYAPATYELDPLLRPFDEHRPMEWVWGWSLRDHRPILVASRLAFYSSGSVEDSFVFECSNGCASGSCLEEAILFGLLELIERDAFLLAWYGNVELTEIDIGDASPQVRAMVDRAALQGYRVRLFDNRIDLAVPVVTGVAVRRDDGPGTLSFAAGASLDPDAAVRSALSEILTYVPAMPIQVRRRRAELTAMASDFSLVRALRDHPGLFGLPEMARHARRYLEPSVARPMAEVYRTWEESRPRSHDLLDDVRFCRDELVRAGFDVIAVDQTTPEQAAAGVSNVSMIVPGLLPIDFGWHRQRALHLPRMFTALRRAGLRTTDLVSSELHHVPHPFP